MELNKHIILNYRSDIDALESQRTSQCFLPGRFMGRQMRDLFLCGGPSLVLARRHIQSAWVPLVVHIFPPLITNSSPFRTALVMIPESTCGGEWNGWRESGNWEDECQDTRLNEKLQCMNTQRNTILALNQKT